MGAVVLAAALAAHTAFGPALFLSTYRACLEYELPEGGIAAHRQAPVPIRDDKRDRASCWLASEEK